ncbi:hypothetical protein BD410DRAFT_787209 [Rickenella mellea]|uniref:Uncharacterized protein n=1 Tax=Rickenella mellea TaxID=50990 RepID=A0A4Y7Q7U8_9AGAM|nr:hypothetical protein BD410DRAFT_787209 [Rickenella mellea]
MESSYGDDHLIWGENISLKDMIDSQTDGILVTLHTTTHSVATISLKLVVLKKS